MFKTIRDADIDKVDDCRDDIDTLLVFAGLYSAVLTAFVIESYTHLQQDPQDVIIGLLERIAAQNFVTGPGFINSTTLPPSSPPFEPPLWAIRVNVLWFTSLIFSLGSASFGILVKQWLREFLSIEYTVPQQRLRARQYRYPALSQWKVFEIAACLPLLLQLSLGLFFVGLCFFTSAVHNSVGRTTIPLVCAWAFLFVATIIAPLFSPRCPFKMTFLKGSLKSARRLCSPFTLTIGRLSMLFWDNTISVIAWFFYSPSAIWAQTKEIQWTWAPYLVGALWFLLSLPFSVPKMLLGALWRIIPQRPFPAEEEDIVKTEGEDVDILLSVDSLNADDGLLPVMLNALSQQSGADPRRVVRFVSRIIARRTDRDMNATHLAFGLDLSRLSKYAWSTMTDALAATLHQHGRHLTEVGSHSGWVYNATVILLSKSPYNLSETAGQAVAGVFAPLNPPDHPCIFRATPGLRAAKPLGNATSPRAQSAPFSITTTSEISNPPSESRATESDGGVSLFGRVPPVIPVTAWAPPPEPGSYTGHTITISSSVRTPERPLSSDVSGVVDVKLCLRCILDAYKLSLCKVQDCLHPSLHHLMSVHPLAREGRSTLQDLFDVILPLLLWRLDHPAETDGWDEACYFVLEYGDSLGRARETANLYSQMLANDRGIHTILVLSAALDPQSRLSRGYGDRPRHQLVIPRDRLVDAVPVRTDPYRVLARICEDRNDVPLNYVRLCRACLLDPNSLGLSSMNASWEMLSRAVKAYSRTSRAGAGGRDPQHRESPATSSASQDLFTEDQVLACECLEICAQTRRSVPDSLINALWPFVPETRAEELGRLLHLRKSRRGVSDAEPQSWVSSSGGSDRGQSFRTSRADEIAIERRRLERRPGTRA